jgi:hypothetical protein
MKTSVRYVFASACLSSAFLSSLALAADPNQLCYIPGLEGDGAYVASTVAPALKAKSINIKVYNVKARDQIQDHAKRFAKMLEADLAQDPEYTCHIIGHSMGGLIARYSLNHLTVMHPTLGVQPLSRFIRSVTTVATPHRGTPLTNADIGKYVPAAGQMAEDEIQKWNDPAYPDTYSPVVPGVPFFSYRSYLKNALQVESLIEYKGYDIISKALKAQGRDTRNDSVVPLDSQGFGEVLGDLNVNHVFFSSKTNKKNPTITQFYEMHAKWLAENVH